MNIKSHKAYEEFLDLEKGIRDGKYFDDEILDNLSKEALAEAFKSLLVEQIHNQTLALQIKMKSGISMYDIPQMLDDGWQFVKVEFNQTNGAKSE